MEDDTVSFLSSNHDRGPQEPTVPQPQSINFQLGSRYVYAEGLPSDRVHPSVFRLRVRPRILDYIAETLFLLASAVVPSIRSSFPEWFLPERIVLKRRKDGWEEEFEIEMETYEMLRPLQGHVVPVFYGQVKNTFVPAIVLSDVGGHCLAEPEGAVLSPEDLRPLLHLAQSSLASLGVLHDDTKLDNFCLTDNHDKVMVVDFEQVTTEEIKRGQISDKDVTFLVECHTNFLMDRYKEHLKCLKYDGLYLGP